MESRIPKFYELSVQERLHVLRERGLLADDDLQSMLTGQHTLDLQRADKMIENVIGVLGLPVGLGLNFLINGRDYVIPLAVEEPSIVAALSSAARIARDAGGFWTESTEPILIGQIQIVDVRDPARARAAVLARKQEILDLANSLHPKLAARGGGAVDVEVLIHPVPDGGRDLLGVHLLVNTCDAMGANLVNTMCEGVSALVETITQGRAFMRILSNLTDRALVSARVVIPTRLLAGKGYSGEEVRDGIALASDLAHVDPYRAATHNKGVMNGVDAVALATGNDWRALEAAAHAYAARGSTYSSLTRWYKTESGDLAGFIELPMKVGTVGGPVQSNPTVAVNHRLLGVTSARELAEVMGAVGLAQNFSALRALVTEGIQQGHMTLHARTVTAAAGATPDIFDEVVERLLDGGEIKVWKAQEIVAELLRRPAAAAQEQPASAAQDQPAAAAAVRQPAQDGALRGQRVPSGTSRDEDGYAAGHGKVILIGEHAVVYGRHAVAAPLPLAIRARVEDGDDGISLIIPKWGVEQRFYPDRAEPGSFMHLLELVLTELGLADRALRVVVHSDLPRAAGLGGSAALGVAVIRAVDRHFRLGLSDAEVCALAFEAEKVAHGTPSGVDNTVATYGQPLLYRRGEPPLNQALIQPLILAQPLPMVVGLTGVESLTVKTVTRVREAWERNRDLYERIFDGIDDLALAAAKALVNSDLSYLGELMNVCQGQLNALQVSGRQIEELLQIARENGAVGAKLTGGGGGGSVIALCPEDGERVVRAMQEAGYEAMQVHIG